jgi:hypothetical protein
VGFQSLDLACRDVNGKPTGKPTLADTYVTAMSTALPNIAYLIGDPDYDILTLSSNAILRNTIVGAGKATYATLSVDWRHPTLHELDPTGNVWVDQPDGSALRFQLSVTTGMQIDVYYMSVQFAT